MILQTFNAKLDLQNLSQEVIAKILNNYSEEIIANTKEIIAENAKDLVKLERENPKYDRLLLNEERIKAIANDVKILANYQFNPFATIETRTGAKGIKIKKNSCPLGVVGIIYESRPNVTVDAISLCLKSQNACILKGSTEAQNTNQILVNIAKSILEKNTINSDIFNLLPSSREATLELITARGLVDICIPRGGKNLIDFVLENATIPVIETGAGVVHVFIDDNFDIEIARRVIFNSKTRRPSVCNSLDCLVVSQKSLKNILEFCQPVIDYGVKIFADGESYQYFGDASNVSLANNEHFGTEFLSLALSVKTVENIQEAIKFINKNSSKHTECIVTNDINNAQKFLKNIDASTVMHNTATSFADGGCFNMVSEIGISTQKLHARGPFSLSELLTYKWIVESDGAVR